MTLKTLEDPFFFLIIHMKVQKNKTKETNPPRTNSVQPVFRF